MARAIITILNKREYIEKLFRPNYCHIRHKFKPNYTDEIVRPRHIHVHWTINATLANFKSTIFKRGK